MCEALKELMADVIQEEADKAYNAAKDEDAVIIAEKDILIAEKDSEIALLRAQLAEALK